jgi:hypothetical protein
MQPGIIHHRWWNSERNPLSFSLQVSSAPPSAVTTYHTTLMQVLSSIFISTDGPITPAKRCSIRHITARVGAAVVRAAVAEDLAEGCCDVGPRELASMSEVPRYTLEKKNVTFLLLKFKTYCSVSNMFLVCCSRKQLTTSLGKCGTLFTAPLWATNKPKNITTCIEADVPDVPLKEYIRLKTFVLTAFC